MANGGNIKNGVSATAANHSTTYNEFGSIHLSKNAGIGITNTANLISASKLTVQDHATLETIPGTGKVNIADFESWIQQKMNFYGLNQRQIQLLWWIAQGLGLEMSKPIRSND